MQVCEPDQKGRQFCVTGPNPCTDGIVSAADGRAIDILMHEAWTGALQAGGLHSQSTADSAAQAAALASAVDACCIMFSPRGSLANGMPVASSKEQDRELCEVTEERVAASTVVAAPPDMHVAVFGGFKESGES